MSEDASFAPAWPAASNPVMRRPPDPVDKVFVDDPNAARVLDFANGLYALLLRLLVQCFGRNDDCTPVLMHAATALMHILGEVSAALTQMPASHSHPGINAGMTFTMLRSVAPLVVGAAELRLIVERFDALIGAAPVATRANPALAGFEGRLREARDTLTASFNERGVSLSRLATGFCVSRAQSKHSGLGLLIATWPLPRMLNRHVPAYLDIRGRKRRITCRRSRRALRSRVCAQSDAAASDARRHRVPALPDVKQVMNLATIQARVCHRGLSFAREAWDAAHGSFVIDATWAVLCSLTTMRIRRMSQTQSNLCNRQGRYQRSAIRDLQTLREGTLGKGCRHFAGGKDDDPQTLIDRYVAAGTCRRVRAETGT